MMLKIEKGIKIPAMSGKKAGPVLTTARMMKVGDSFALDKSKAVYARIVLSQAKIRKALDKGMQFTSRTSEDGKTVRFWRIK